MYIIEYVSRKNRKIPWCIASYHIIKLPNARGPINSTGRDSWTVVKATCFADETFGTFAVWIVRNARSRSEATIRNQFYLKWNKKRFNTRKHWNYTFIISSWANIFISISEKRANSRESTSSSQDQAQRNWQLRLAFCRRKGRKCDISKRSNP